MTVTACLARRGTTYDKEIFVFELEHVLDVLGEEVIFVYM